MIFVLALVVAGIGALLWLVQRHLDRADGGLRLESIGPELLAPPPRVVRLTASVKWLLGAAAAAAFVVPALIVRDRHNHADELAQLRAHGVNSVAIMTGRSARSTRGFRRRYRVRYAYQVDGRLYSGDVESRRLYERFQRGARIPVVYLPHSPTVSRVGHGDAIPASLPARVRTNGWWLAALVFCGFAFGVWRVWTEQERRKVLASEGVPVLATVVKSRGGFHPCVDITFAGPLGDQAASKRCSLMFSSRTPAGSRIVALVKPTNALDVQLYEHVRAWVVVDEPTPQFGRVVSGPSAL